jgi:hypothetical protein
MSVVAPSNPREIHNARMPSALDSIAESTLSAGSCECGRKKCVALAMSPEAVPR